MSGHHRRDNVEPIPVRKDLPPEIAALALPQQEGEAPLVVLNANEENQRATFTLFKLQAFVAAALAWIGSRTARWAREHQVAAATITATATSVAIATGANLALDGDRTPAALPPQTITIISAQPNMTVTLTPSPNRTAPTAKPSAKAAKTAGPTQPPIIVADWPEPTVEPTHKPTVKRTARDTVKPTTRPTTRQPSVSSEATAPPAQDAAAERTPERHSSSPQPSPGSPPAQEPDPTTAAAHCGVRVDLDPILDLCVLS